jgi:hypothetical protein
MTSNLLRRTGAIAALSLTLSLSLAACGGSDDDAKTTGSTKDTTSSAEPSAQGADMAGADTFGPGCKLIPADGAGSFNGMATAPVATAASANPLLKTLVTAVGEAGLVDTLNSADALAKIPSDTLNGLLADKKMLTTVLTHHVVAGKLSPDQLAGTHKTLAGDTIEVEGSGEDFTVAGANAKVLCGNIPTANATVYVIDTVLVP